METWRTAIDDAGPDHIRIRGRDLLELMSGATFTDLIFLLYHERVPTAPERRLIDAILIGSADHGAGAPSCAAARLAASGNRQSPSAAVAAGLLTLGDEHGGGRAQPPGVHAPRAVAPPPGGGPKPDRLAGDPGGNPPDP